MFTTLVVPVDGSDFAAKAIPTAVAIAGTSQAGLRVVGIARDDGELSWVYDHVHDAAHQVPASLAPVVDVVVDPDPTGVLLGIAADRDNALCFASHDQMRVAAKVMHSVGSPS